MTDKEISERVFEYALSYYTASEIDKADKNKFPEIVAEHLRDLASKKQEVLNKSRIDGETLDLECNRIYKLIENTQEDIEMLEAAQIEKNEQASELFANMKAVEELYRKAKEQYDDAIQESQLLARRCAMLLEHKEKYEEEKDAVVQCKEVFLNQRDAKNYFGGGTACPEDNCFLANMDIRRIREKLLISDNGAFDALGEKKLIDDLSRSQLSDVCQFLKNGGYNHNPFMKELGTTIHVSRMKNFLGQNESIFEQRERLKMYLGIVPHDSKAQNQAIGTGAQGKYGGIPRTATSCKKRAVEEFLTCSSRTAFSSPRMKKNRTSYYYSSPLLSKYKSPARMNINYKKTSPSFTDHDKEASDDLLFLARRIMHDDSPGDKEEENDDISSPQKRHGS